MLSKKKKKPRPSFALLFKLRHLTHSSREYGFAMKKGSSISLTDLGMAAIGSSSPLTISSPCASPAVISSRTSPIFSFGGDAPILPWKEGSTSTLFAVPTLSSKVNSGCGDFGPLTFYRSSAVHSTSPLKEVPSSTLSHVPPSLPEGSNLLERDNTTLPGSVSIVTAIRKPDSVAPETERKENFEVAKLFVRVDLTTQLPQKIVSGFSNGREVVIDFSYPWLPVKCDACKKYGHKMDIFPAVAAAAPHSDNNIKNSRPEASRKRSKSRPGRSGFNPSKNAAPRYSPVKHVSNADDTEAVSDAAVPDAAVDKGKSSKTDTDAAVTSNSLQEGDAATVVENAQVYVDEAKEAVLEEGEIPCTDKNTPDIEFDTEQALVQLAEDPETKTRLLICTVSDVDIDLIRSSGSASGVDSEAASGVVSEAASGVLSEAASGVDSVAGILESAGVVSEVGVLTSAVVDSNLAQVVTNDGGSDQEIFTVTPQVPDASGGSKDTTVGLEDTSFTSEDTNLSLLAGPVSEQQEITRSDEEQDPDNSFYLVKNRKAGRRAKHH